MERVTLFCFFASYTCALMLEIARVWVSSGVLRISSLVLASAGLVAHTAYLLTRSRATELPPLLGSTHDWLLVLGWLAVCVYLFASVALPRVAIGPFLLPWVLLVVGGAAFVNSTPNPRLTSLYWSGLAHATGLVLGIVGVVVSLVLSMMYLAQHRRLKRKLVSLEGMKLLSLESLARMNWWSIVLSVPLLSFGMVTGIFLSLASQRTDNPVPLTQWQFLANGLLWAGMMGLFVWLLVSRKAAGRLVAWRTVLACGFLLITLLVLQMFSRDGIHGSGAEAEPAGRQVPLLACPAVRLHSGGWHWRLVRQCELDDVIHVIQSAGLKSGAPGDAALLSPEDEVGATGGLSASANRTGIPHSRRSPAGERPFAPQCSAVAPEMIA